MENKELMNVRIFDMQFFPKKQELNDCVKTLYHVLPKIQHKTHRFTDLNKSVGSIFLS